MIPETRDDMTLTGSHVSAILGNVSLAGFVGFLNALAHFLTVCFALWRECRLVLAQTLNHTTTSRLDVRTELLDICATGAFGRESNGSLPE